MALKARALQRYPSVIDLNRHARVQWQACGEIWRAGGGG